MIIGLSIYIGSPNFEYYLRYYNNYLVKMCILVFRF